MAKREIPQLVMAGKRPRLPEHLPPAVVQLIERCWNEQPESRPTAENILQELQEIALEESQHREPIEHPQ